MSSEKDKMLYYTGQILSNQDIQHTGNPIDVMLDLSLTSFFVPIIHKNSTIVYSIISDIHCYHKVAKHSGVETFNALCFAEGLYHKKTIPYETNQKKSVSDVDIF